MIHVCLGLKLHATNHHWEQTHQTEQRQNFDALYNLVIKASDLAGVEIHSLSSPDLHITNLDSRCYILLALQIIEW